MTEPFLIRPDIVDGERRRAAVEQPARRAGDLADLERAGRSGAHPGANRKQPQIGRPGRARMRKTSGAFTGSTTRIARDRAPVPGHVVLPEALTGVKAPIVVLLGRRFPMIGAHKVLAAYACLVPRLVTGQFDPTHDRAVWPSTGNYCRGGVAISRILGCRGVAVLPAGMSRERFDWLQAMGLRSRPTSSARRERKATSRKSTTSAPSSRATSTMSFSTSSPNSPTT